MQYVLVGRGGVLKCEQHVCGVGEAAREVRCVVLVARGRRVLVAKAHMRGCHV